jgi:hypothetical protein
MAKTDTKDKIKYFRDIPEERVIRKRGPVPDPYVSRDLETGITFRWTSMDGVRSKDDVAGPVRTTELGRRIVIVKVKSSDNG